MKFTAHAAHVVIRALQQLEIETSVPKAALYVWFRFQLDTSDGFSSALLERAHVSLTPDRFGSGVRVYSPVS
jgi:aspartate/methionine/tyrosine aminotransferase